MKYFEEKKLLKKCKKNDAKVELGKMKIKTYFVLFSNARSILELMFCNRNLTKLVNPTFLSLKAAHKLEN